MYRIWSSIEVVSYSHSFISPFLIFSALIFIADIAGNIEKALLAVSILLSTEQLGVVTPVAASAQEELVEDKLSLGWNGALFYRLVLLPIDNIWCKQLSGLT